MPDTLAQMRRDIVAEIKIWLDDHGVGPGGVRLAQATDVLGTAAGGTGSTTGMAPSAAAVAWAGVTGKPSTYPADLTTIPDATTSVRGLMLAADKAKLNGIATGAQVNVLESVSGTGPIVVAAVSAKSQAISLSLLTAANLSPTSAVAQTQIAYDASEAGTLDTLTGASTLINTLNRIRYTIWTMVNGRASGSWLSTPTTNLTQVQADLATKMPIATGGNFGGRVQKSIGTAATSGFVGTYEGEFDDGAGLSLKAQNAISDGTSWQRTDTTKPSWLEVKDTTVNDLFRWFHAAGTPAGGGPTAIGAVGTAFSGWTEFMQLRGAVQQLSLIASGAASYALRIILPGDNFGRLSFRPDGHAAGPGNVAVDTFWLRLSAGVWTTLGGVISSARQGPIAATKTADYTIVAGDELVPVNAAAGNIVITLPSSASVPGQVFDIARMDSSANTLTVQVTASPAGQTINGATSRTITGQYTVLKVKSYGSSGWVVY